MTVIGDEEPVACKLPGLEVTVYEVIVAPPLLVGAVKDTVASPFPTTAMIFVGASGAVI